MSLPILECPAGSTETWTLTFRDEMGDAIDYSSNAPSLSLRVWPGDDRAVISFAASTIAFASAAAGTATLTIDGSDTSSLAPADYRVQVGLTSSGETTWRDAGTLRLTASPGSSTLPDAYGTADGVRRLAGEWLVKVVGGTAVQSGYAEELGDARHWTDRQILDRARAKLLARLSGDLSDPDGRDLMTATDSAFDALTESDYSISMRAELRLAVVRADLDANGLILTGAEGRAIREANEHHAAWLILARTLASKDDRAGLLGIAGWHKGRANYLLASATFRIDGDADADVDYVISPG